MTNIVSSNQKIQTEETDYRSALSEALMQKIGGSVNYCIDQIAANAAGYAAADASIIANLFQITNQTDTTGFYVNDPYVELVYTCPAGTMAFLEYAYGTYDAGWDTYWEQYVKVTRSYSGQLAITGNNTTATLAAGEDLLQAKGQGILLFPGDTIHVGANEIIAAGATNHSITIKYKEITWT